MRYKFAEALPGNPQTSKMVNFPIITAPNTKILPIFLVFMSTKFLLQENRSSIGTYAVNSKWILVKLSGKI